MAISARNTGRFEKDSPAANRIARQLENLLRLYDTAQTLYTLFRRKKTLKQIANAHIAVLDRGVNGT